MERIYGFLEVRDCLSHCANDRCLRIATKRWLQDSSDLGISVVYELLASTTRALTQSVDDITQSQQGTVDVLSFSKSDAFCLCLAGSLRSSQIDQIQLGDFDFARCLLLFFTIKSCFRLALRFDIDSEHSVAS